MAANNDPAPRSNNDPAPRSNNDPAPRNNNVNITTKANRNVDFITDDELDIYNTYISTLPFYSTFLSSQYTHHGDKIINALLRGMDNINIYDINIQNPKRINTTGIFFCLYLPDFSSPEMFKLYDEITTLDKKIHEFVGRINNLDKLTEELREKWNIFWENYKNVVYPSIEERIAKNDLRFFHTITYQKIKELYKIIKNAPSIDRVFTVYRGVENFYLNKNPSDIFKLPTFQSTTIEKDNAISFVNNLRAPKLYKFKVHPECVYMYMEPLTLHKEELEILLAPGNRYAFLSEEGTTQTYAVLPPERDYELPETYGEYIEYLKTVQKETNFSEENRAALGRIKRPMAGGNTRKRKGSKRMVTRKRASKSYKHRGGLGTPVPTQVPADTPINTRWTETPGEVIEVTKRNANDKKMIDDILKGFV